MLKSLVRLGIIAALSVVAPAAVAATYEVTLTGTSEKVNDFQNVFGFGSEAVGSPANLTDQSFVETFIVNTDAPFSSATGVSNNSIIDSGPAAVSGSLSIGGSTAFTVSGVNFSSLFTSFGYQVTTSEVVPPAGARLSNEMDLDLSGPGLPTTVDQTGSFAIGPGTSISVADSFIDETSGGEFPDAIGTLYATSLTIQSVSAAPEPSAWLLMMGGSPHSVWLFGANAAAGFVRPPLPEKTVCAHRPKGFIPLDGAKSHDVRL